VRRAAATLGLEPEAFRWALEVSVAQVPAPLRALRRPDGVISRETWNQAFADLVCAIGLGAPCDPQDGGDCSCRL